MNNDNKPRTVRRPMPLAQQQAMIRRNASSSRECGECFRSGVHAPWCDKTR